MNNEVPLYCEVCGHKWSETIELPMNAEAAIARMRGWEYCPKCGSKKVSFSTQQKTKTMNNEVVMAITERDAQGQKQLRAELDKDQASDYLAHVDARYEAYRRAHLEEHLKPLPPGEWEKYLDWAIQQDQQGVS